MKRKIVAAIRALAAKQQPKWFLADYKSLKISESQTVPRFRLHKNDMWPCLSDKTSSLDFERHYTLHPAWAARKIALIRPETHIDISSILSFVTVVSAFVPVQYFDYRPASISLPGFSSAAQDLTKLSFSDSSVLSLSCMHTVEHIGLGRYGDPIDYNGDLKAMSELSRVLSVNGNLLFVVPVGAESLIQFNAHRIYRPDQIIHTFQDFGLTLKEFSYIPQYTGDIVTDASIEDVNDKYGCGCFWFSKL